jgi:tripartite-type tricarboxylate transporter receptor subunit TctC
MRLWIRLLGCVMTIGLAVPVEAQTAKPGAGYPNRPVRLLIGFAPGGSADLIGRLIAQRLSDAFGQSVLVENRMGAGGMIAAEAVAKAPPDGHMLVLIPSGHATQAVMMKSLAFDPVADFAWVSTITTYPMVVAVAPGSPIQSLADLIARAKVAPGKLSYATAGIGTGHHLLGEWISAEAGIEMTQVAFKGGTAGLVEVTAGRVDVWIETMTLALPNIRSGKARALGVTTRRPYDALPGVPTVAATLPAIEYDSWLGIATSPGTPPDVVERLATAMRRAIEEPETRQRLADLGGVPSPSTPAEFRERVVRDIGKFRAIVDTRKLERQ